MKTYLVIIEWHTGKQTSSKVLADDAESACDKVLNNLDDAAYLDACDWYAQLLD